MKILNKIVNFKKITNVYYVIMVIILKMVNVKNNV